MVSLSKNHRKVVVVGGGTGVYTVLSGLRNYNIDLTAVISMADDGGSTGVLREEFGILPLGDARRALVALSRADNRLLSDLFNYRFEDGTLKGHAFGNIMLTALERVTGSFEEALVEAGKMLGANGQVLPVTCDNVKLCAELENGLTIRGESNIDAPKHDGRLKIKKVFLDPEANASKKAKEAIAAADLIVIGPGDLYTSIVPNLLVRGIPQAIRKSRAKKVYVVNIMTKWGETKGFTVSNFIAVVERYVGKDILDYAVINTKAPSSERLRLYEKEFSEFVVAKDLSRRPTPIFGDFLRRSGFVRHDSDRLAKVLMSLI